MIPVHAQRGPCWGWNRLMKEVRGRLWVWPTAPGRAPFHCVCNAWAELYTYPGVLAPTASPTEGQNAASNRHLGFARGIQGVGMAIALHFSGACARGIGRSCISGPRSQIVLSASHQQLAPSCALATPKMWFAGCLGVVTEMTLRCIPQHNLLEKSWVTDMEGVRKDHTELLDKYRHVRYLLLSIVGGVCVFGGWVT